LKKKTLHYSSVKSLFCIGLRPQAAVQALLIAQAIGGVGWGGVGWGGGVSRWLSAPFFVNIYFS